MEQEVRYDAKSSLINIYMQQISKFPLLTQEEETKLSKRIKNGDLSAKQAMIESNLRLVAYIVKNYNTNNSAIGYMDLIQEGNIGLMEAVDRFDPEKGFKFSTYASWWIKQSISKFVGERSGSIRLPAHIVDALSKIKKSSFAFEQLNNRTPTEAELADLLDLDPLEIDCLLKSQESILSLDEVVNEDNDTSMVDLFSDTKDLPSDRINKEYTLKMLLDLLGTLDKREKEILILRYGLESGSSMSLEDIGSILGLTRERVRQLEIKAIRKLRQPLRMATLKEIFEEVE